MFLRDWSYKLDVEYSFDEECSLFVELLVSLATLLLSWATSVCSYRKLTGLFVTKIVKPCK